MERNEIKQTSAVGSKNTQIGVQNNYYGEKITIETVMGMVTSACSMYYPILREEALKAVCETVREELDRYEPAVLVEPSPRIVFPVLQNSGMTEEPNLRAMYGKLLAHSMDAVSSNNAHPSFVEIINQMSSFDAILFKEIVEINDSIPVASITFNYDDRCFIDEFPQFYGLSFEKFNDPWNVSFSIENLARLNIIELLEKVVSNYNYDQIKENEFVLERYNNKKESSGIQNLEIKMRKYAIRLNDFGRRFAEMCL